MAIGTTAAILASTAISAGTAIVSGSKQASAAKQSAAAIQNATDQSSATQRYIYDQTRADNLIRQKAGDAATLQMAALLGLGGQSQPQQPGQPPGQPAVTRPQTAPAGVTYDYSGSGVGRTMERDAESGLGVNAMSMGGMGDPQVWPQMPGNALAAGGMPIAAADSNALQTDPTAWLRSTPGYQFNFDEGQRALNTGLASRGKLFSGDAARETIRYGQNYGDRIYGDQYNRLAGLAGSGQVASSQTQQGGQNYANAMTSLNQNNANAKASSYQNGANAWTNALGGAAGAGMWAVSQFGGMK